MTIIIHWNIIIGFPWIWLSFRRGGWDWPCRTFGVLLGWAYTIAKIVGVLVVLGLLVALLSSQQYATKSALMPELQSSESTAGSLHDRFGGNDQH